MEGGRCLPPPRGNPPYNLAGSRRTARTDSSTTSALMSRSMAAAPTERTGAMSVFVLELQRIRIPGTWVSKRVWIANKGRRCTPAAHHYVPAPRMRQRGEKDTPPEWAIWPTARASLPNPLSASATYPFGPEAFPTSALVFASIARPRCGQLTYPPMRITPSRMAKPCCSATAHSGRTALFRLRTSRTPRLRRRSRPRLREIARDGAPL